MIIFLIAYCCKKSSWQPLFIFKWACVRNVFLSSYHHENFRSYYHWQKWCHAEVKVGGQISRSKRSKRIFPQFGRFRTTVTPVWIHTWLWNDAQSSYQTPQICLVMFFLSMLLFCLLLFICSSILLLSSLMMTSSNGHLYRVTGPLWGEFTGHLRIPLTKASDAELWYILWYAPKQTIQQTVEMTATPFSLWCHHIRCPQNLSN